MSNKKYLTIYETEDEYTNDMTNFDEVNVSYIKESDEVKYYGSLIESPKIGYIEFDSSNSDPANITKVDDNGVIETILSKFHRVIAKDTGEGQVTIYQLDDTNSNKYVGGSPADLTGTDGDVMVYFPTFYYKGETTEKGYRFNFSLDPIEGYHEAKESLVGVYKGYVDQEKLYSKSGVESTGNISMSDFSTYAKSRGTGYHLIDYQQHCILCWMFYCKYLTRNSQEKCGTGPNKSEGVNSGSTNSLGMKDTTPDINGTDTLVNFLGLEGCWSYKGEFIEGVHSHSSDGVIAYDKGDYHDKEYSEVASSTKRELVTEGDSSTGWISEIYSGEYMDMVGKTYSGSESTYFCDRGGVNPSGTYIFYRSGSHDMSPNGVSYLGSEYSSSITDSFIGSRLAFDGEIIWGSK